VEHFLCAGYSVRGTVRSAETADKVRQSFRQYDSKLSFAIVEDVGADGAFDTAVQGVHGVIHTATPFQVGVVDVERDLLNPAINGTLNILHAVHNLTPTVKRILFTSSFFAMINLAKGKWPGHVYSEADWNPATIEDATAKDASGGLAYAVAKTLAERAAWDFVQDKKPHFDIATVLPSMIYGPNINATATLARPVSTPPRQISTA
jgi:nucleoside-diphosphate-sugar epimerase